MTLSADSAELASRVRLLVLDVDGVLTDGRLYYGEGGESLKAFHVHDGFGVRLLLSADVEVAVVSARRSSIVRKRLADLGVRHVLDGRDDKRAALESLSLALSVPPAEIAFVGDDVLDVPALRWVGLPVSVADAHAAAKAHAKWVTERRGGDGAVREIADELLRARGALERVIEDLLATRLGAGAHEKA